LWLTKDTAFTFWFTHVVQCEYIAYPVLARFTSAAKKPERVDEVCVSPAYRPELPTGNPSGTKMYATRTFHLNNFALSWCIFFNFYVVSTRD